MIERSLFVEFGREIASAIAAEIRERGFLLSDFPRLTNDGFGARTKAVRDGRGIGSVNLPSALKAFIKRRFPEFVFSSSSNDHHRFEKRIAGNLAAVLLFERIHHFGLGKAFTIHLICEQTNSSEESIWCKHCLFQFFDRSLLEWTYATREDLDACLEEAALLLQQVLPSYADAWAALDETGESNLLLSRPEHGALSFREAARLAFEAILPNCPQYSYLNAAWFREGTPIFLPPAHQIIDTPESLSGRLSPNRTWHIRFADVSAARTLTVVVPRRGWLAFALSDTLGMNKAGIHHRVRAQPVATEPLTLPGHRGFQPEHRAVPASWEGFADSTDIMKIAASAGGQDFRDRHPDCALQLDLNAEVSDPPTQDEYWYVHYFVRHARDRADLAFRISARDREILNL